MTTEAPPYIEVNNLIKRYDSKTILTVDELTIYKGEVLALIGANGSGKSTLLRAIAHLEPINEGNIRFVADSQQPDSLTIRRRLAMVFQESLLFAGSVRDNISYGLKMRHTPKGNIAQRVQRVAEMLGIDHLLDRSASRLSGGEAQRVSLARAIILEPELLLLDEPMASLDPPTREALLGDLHRILNSLNITVIYVTHELTEALTIADRFAVMDGGRIAQIGDPKEVMNSPANRKIAGFVGIENIIPGEIVGESDGVVRVKVDGSEIEAVNPDAITGNIWVLIRPENVNISIGELTQKTSVRNQFTGTVATILNLGAFYRVIIDCGFTLFAYITKQSAEEIDLKPGKQIRASFKATGVHMVSRR